MEPQIYDLRKMGFFSNSQKYFSYVLSRSRTVKNAVELLGAPSRNSILMLKKYNITDEIFWLSSHVFFFFYPANEQESSTLAQYKNFVLVSD
jgi:hypothetical protein